MKKLPSQEYLKILFRYYEDSGKLYWRTRPREHFKCVRSWNMWNGKFAMGQAGSNRKDGYNSVTIDREYYATHRVIWKLVTGEDPPEYIDHKLGRDKGNPIINLRLATNIENNCNSRTRKNKRTSVYKGVHFSPDRGTFIAQIQVNKVKKHLGCFVSEVEAHKAYCAAAVKYHGEFSNTGEKQGTN
jgi:hypothetical protein